MVTALAPAGGGDGIRDDGAQIPGLGVHPRRLGTTRRAKPHPHPGAGLHRHHPRPPLADDGRNRPRPVDGRDSKKGDEGEWVGELMGLGSLIISAELQVSFRPEAAIEIFLIFNASQHARLQNEGEAAM